ncbi:hypothetical protein D9M68_664980 [compost metagenome]
MDLPEALRIQLLGQFAQAGADQRLAGAGDHIDVLVGRFQIDHLVDRDDSHLLPDQCLDKAQVLARRPAGAGRGVLEGFEPRQQLTQAVGVEHGGLCLGVVVRLAIRLVVRHVGHRLQPFLEAAHGSLQPLALHRLEHIIDRGALEGLQRKLVIGGNKDHQRRDIKLDQLACHVHAAHARHADIQESHARLVLARGGQRGHAVVHDRDDAGLGPQRLQFGFQHAREQRFVVGDQKGRGHGGDGWGQ